MRFKNGMHRKTRARTSRLMLSQLGCILFVLRKCGRILESPGIRPDENGRRRWSKRLAVDIRKHLPARMSNIPDQRQIIEGVAIQIIAIAAWFIIIDFPDKAHKKGFLTKSDADFMEMRIDEDRGDAVPDALTWRVFGRHLLDLKLWAL
jgi:hypothetical protein